MIVLCCKLALLLNMVSMHNLGRSGNSLIVHSAAGALRKFCSNWLCPSYRDFSSKSQGTSAMIALSVFISLKLHLTCRNGRSIWLWLALCYCCIGRNEKIQYQPRTDVYFLVSHCCSNNRLTGKRDTYRPLMRNHLAVNKKRESTPKCSMAESMSNIYSSSHARCLFLIFMHSFFLHVWSQTKKNVIRRHEQTNREWQKV